jgi:hypothetical protein
VSYEQEDRDEIHRALGRVEGKIDMLISSNTAQVAKCNMCDDRFKKLETDGTRFKTIAYGAAALASALGAERLAKMFHLPF